MKRWNDVRARVDSYLLTHRELGYKLRVVGHELYRYASFADERGHVGALTLNIALAWANDLKRGTNATRAWRLGIARKLAKYCALFEPETEVPPAGLYGPSYRRVTPHIYSEKELEMLMKEAEELKTRDGLRPVTMRCLLGLLASTGLRISEALSLDREDFEPDKGLLTVCMTKFRKSRYVPLHETTIEELVAYCRVRDLKAPPVRDSSFFIKSDGHSFSYDMADYAFRRIRRRLGWDKSEKRLPRLYDLRHTFACRRLLAWYSEGTDIDWAMPLLSTYLGHVSVENTYWYLTGIPELMAIAAERFENYAREGQEVEHE